MNRRTATISAAVSPAEKSRVEAIAALEGVSASDLVRAAVVDSLTRHRRRQRGHQAPDDAEALIRGWADEVREEDETLAGLLDAVADHIGETEEPEGNRGREGRGSYAERNPTTPPVSARLRRRRKRQS